MKQNTTLDKIVISLLLLVGIQINTYADSVTYKQGAKNETVSLSKPNGSQVVFNTTYQNDSYVQLTGGTKMTYTFSGFDEFTITGVTLSMKSNASKGKGSLDIKVGNSSIAKVAESNFNSSGWNGNWSTSFVDVSPTITKKKVGDNELLTITISATENSLYCQSVTIEYETPETYVESPTLPASCDFEGSKQITITDNAEGATIYYTTDGTEPSESSTQYTGPFTITETTTVKAVAIKNGMTSAVSEAIYSLVVNQPTSTVTAILTSDEIKNKKDTGEGYYNGNLVGSTCGDWTGYFLSDQTNGRLQLKSDDREGYYIQSPEFPANIKSITLTFTASNVNGRGFVIMPSNYSGKTATASTSKCLGSAIYDGTNSKLTVELTEEVKSFKIYATGETIYFSQIEVAYENSASHVLSVGATGWATLYLDQDATIPADVTCYTIASVADGSAILSPITTGVLPAHTGVVIQATANTNYTFNYTYDYTSSQVDNLLRGSFANAHIYGGGYVLSMINDVVGLYKAKETSNLFLNNAYKAYLPASAVPVIQQSNGLRFVVEETTDIEAVQPTQSSEVVIYDLTGRRVEKMEKGIYIINGRKVLNN